MNVAFRLWPSPSGKSFLLSKCWAMETEVSWSSHDFFFSESCDLTTCNASLTPLPPKAWP